MTIRIVFDDVRRMGRVVNAPNYYYNLNGQVYDWLRERGLKDRVDYTYYNGGSSGDPAIEFVNDADAIAFKLVWWSE